MKTADTVYRELCSFFKVYAESHMDSDEDIRTNTILKEEHTYRVCSFSERLASSISLSSHETDCARITALLHDIGRFKQYATHRTFSDLHSENHSAIALRVIHEHGLLDSIADSDSAVIRSAIECHNMQNLPEGLDARTFLHAGIIRDADKLDILPITLDYYERRAHTKNPALEGKLPDTPGFSAEIVDLIAAGKTVSNGMRKNYNDLKLVQLAWMLDLNFPWSYRYALEHQYVEQLMKFLPDDEIIRQLAAEVKRVMAERAE